MPLSTLEPPSSDGAPNGQANVAAHKQLAAPNNGAPTVANAVWRHDVFNLVALGLLNVMNAAYLYTGKGAPALRPRDFQPGHDPPASGLCWD